MLERKTAEHTILQGLPLSLFNPPPRPLSLWKEFHSPSWARFKLSCRVDHRERDCLPLHHRFFLNIFKIKHTSQRSWNFRIWFGFPTTFCIFYLKQISLLVTHLWAIIIIVRITSSLIFLLNKTQICGDDKFFREAYIITHMFLQVDGNTEKLNL